MVQTAQWAINLVIFYLGVGILQLFWYILPFAATGPIAFLIYKKKLKKEYYWLAYAAYLAIVICIANYLAAGARDTIRLWLEVIGAYHAPVMIPLLMIAPALLLAFFLQCLGVGRKRIMEIAAKKRELIRGV